MGDKGNDMVSKESGREEKDDEEKTTREFTCLRDK